MFYRDDLRWFKWDFELESHLWGAALVNVGDLECFRFCVHLVLARHLSERSTP